MNERLEIDVSRCTANIETCGVAEDFRQTADCEAILFAPDSEPTLAYRVFKGMLSMCEIGKCVGKSPGTVARLLRKIEES